MWNPFSVATKGESENAPTPGPHDRVGALLEEVRRCKATLDALNVELRDFCGKHAIQTDRLDRILVCKSDSIRGKAAIYAAWVQLQQRKGRALHEFSHALKAWSDALMETQ